MVTYQSPATGLLVSYEGSFWFTTTDVLQQSSNRSESVCKSPVQGICKGSVSGISESLSEAVRDAMVYGLGAAVAALDLGRSRQAVETQSKLDGHW